MEFGIFLNGYIPGPGAHDTGWEHQQLMREAEVIPEHDSDRLHSTDRYRATAQPKYEQFSRPLPQIAWPTVLPVTAMQRN